MLTYFCLTTTSQVPIVISVQIYMCTKDRNVYIKFVRVSNNLYYYARYLLRLWCSRMWHGGMVSRGRWDMRWWWFSLTDILIHIMEPPTMLLVPICRDMQLWWDKPPIPSPRNRMPGDTCFDDVGRNCACVTWTQMYVTLQTKNVFHSKAVIILFFNPPLC